MRTPPTLLAIALALAACAPSDPSPIKTAALTFDPKKRTYQLSQVQLTTIFPADGGSLAELTGSVAHVVGGAQIVVDESDPAVKSASSDDQLRAAVVKDEGGAVRASFVKSGDVQWPADFHSENMVTTYFNFEKSFAFFQKLGWTQEQAGTPTVYYFPKYVEAAISKDPLQDNAAFFSVVGGFLILPFNQFQDIPLPMNLGIIGHEYTHFMINTRVYGRQAVPQAYADWGGLSPGVPSPAANLLKSLDEGFADLFGTGVTCSSDFASCDPDFIAASIPSQSAPRNLSGVHCYDQTLDASLKGQDLGTFVSESNQYKVGTVFASALWKAATDPDVVRELGQASAVEKAMQTVYDALDDSNASNPGLKQFLTLYKGSPALFTPDWGLAQIIVAHAAHPKLGTALCAAFMDRLGTDRGIGMSEGACVSACQSFTGGTPPNCICACHTVPGASYPQFPGAVPYGDCK